MKLIYFLLLLSISSASCSKESEPDMGCKPAPDYVYYEVGIRQPSQWQDSIFIVRTNDQGIIKAAEEELALPPYLRRKIIFGNISEELHGYNKNGLHQFRWEFDSWILTDVTAAGYDGMPHTDVDNSILYWCGSVKRYGPWSSYLKGRISIIP